MPKIVADEQVFLATRQVVIERGYTGATTKQIADVANISEVTLFRKYGSKAELTRRAIEAMANEIDFETAAQYTGDITADLQRVVQMYQKTADQHGQFFYLLLAEIPRHPELTELVELPFSLMGHIVTLLARYQQEGLLAAEPPWQALAGLIGPLISLNILRTAQRTAVLPTPDLTQHVHAFLYGRLLPKGAE